LYLAQFSMAKRCTLSAGPLVAWDVGLGAAGNAMHLIECWSRHPRRDLHLISFDLDDHALRYALQQRVGDENMFLWLANPDWETVLRQRGQRLQVDGCEMNWEWRLADFPALLASNDGAGLAEPEIVFYDAYSPAKCWNMWRLDHWQRMRRACGERCEIAFHSRATALRVTLLLAGFYVGYGVPVGEKEETTVAATRRDLLRRPLDAAWLEMVKRSTSARPFCGANYGQAPISGKNYAELSAHPQFSGPGTYSLPSLPIG